MMRGSSVGVTLVHSHRIAHFNETRVVLFCADLRGAPRLVAVLAWRYAEFAVLDFRQILRCIG